MEHMKQILHYIGVDFHPYEQTVAYVSDGDGEIKFCQFRHSDKKGIRRFYRQFGNQTEIGVEATGSLYWFEKMLEEEGHRLKIGNPQKIRKMALSSHKNDFRDAKTILELLVTGRFPSVERRSEKSQTVLQMMNYRHFLVKKRTAVGNGLQAFARRKGLEKFRTQARLAKEKLFAAVDNPEEEFLVASRYALFKYLDEEIQKIDPELEKEARGNDRPKLLMTHSGVGPLTALAVIHTLGDVNRFSRKEQVVAFIGLDPLDKSSGQRKRIGQISKEGSRLARFLLIQAAQATKDKRLKAFYKRVSRRRGNQKAKVAAARKLLINCYIMLRDEINYQEFCRRGEVGLCE